MSRRADLLEPAAVQTFLRSLHELIGSPGYSGPNAMRRLNDLRPVVGALLDLAEDRTLVSNDLVWAATELRRRAETLREGGG